ncbi:hypothetical protein RJ40_06170 [Methanofollis aquaemaris]|uniref:WD40 repeat domain-containing protein n=1 Tax=Methanofollis aquaemaris TaxID=126734 RepID=A0A8A3S4X7_9EURY|nr:PQQ-binding-like beta-propeller repeat protein [Methanofollis aquaemaris]QSZ67112.1 hypothetical protein RJ40_06170 [Methanofollis aquaemaris]
MRVTLSILFLLLLSALPTLAAAAAPGEIPLCEVTVPGEIKEIALNTDGTGMAVLSDQTLSWHNSDETPGWEVPANNAETIGVSEDGSLLVSGGADLRTYDRDGGRAFRFDTGYFALGTAVSPEGSCIAAGFDNKSLTVFRADTQDGFEPVWTAGTTEDVISMALADNGSHLAACTRDGMVNSYTGDGRLLWRYDTGSERLTCAVTGDGSYVVVGADHGVVLLLNRNGILIREEVVGERLPAVSISADGSVVAIGGDDGVVLRSLQGDDLGTIGNGSVQAVALSADGSRVAAGQGEHLALFSTGTDEIMPVTAAAASTTAGTDTTGGEPVPARTQQAGLSVLPALAAVALLLGGRR